MSRKKADLRLKKRAESSVSCDTPPNRVQDSGSSRNFTAVSSLSAQNRILLHRLLLGKLPKKMSPFPASQLTDSSPATDSSPKECPQSLHKPQEEEELKWTPLPATNIVGKLAPIRLSMEQLCAPLAEEEGVEEEHVAFNSAAKQSTNDMTLSVDNRSSSLSDFDPISVPTALPNECSVQGAPSHTASVSSSIITQESSGRNSSALASQSSDRHPASTQKPSANNQRQSSSTIKAKGKSVTRANPLNFSQPVKPKGHNDDVIDLTDSSHPPKIAHATTTSTFRDGCNSDTHSRRSAVEQTMPPTSVKKPVETQRVDIDRLCMDVDIDTIGDFSDDDSDLGASDIPPGLNRAQSSVAASTGRTGVSGSDGQSKSGSKGSITGTVGKSWASKGKSHVKDENQLVKNCSRFSGQPLGSIHARTALPGQSALTSRAMADSSPSLKSAVPCPTTTSSGNSSVQRHTADSSSSSRSRFSYPTTTGGANSSGQKRHMTTNAATGGKRFKLDSSRPPHASVTTSYSGHKPGRVTHTNSAGWSEARTAPPTGVHTVPSEQGARVERDPKPGTSWRGGGAGAGAGAGGGGDGGGASGAGGGGAGGDGAGAGGRVQAAQLETCPMCNTHFPTWYTQVDADGHIAQCLQAVMDLEMAHDLVLD